MFQQDQSNPFREDTGHDISATAPSPERPLRCWADGGLPWELVGLNVTGAGGPREPVSRPLVLLRGAEALHRHVAREGGRGMGLCYAILMDQKAERPC